MQFKHFGETALSTILELLNTKFKSKVDKVEGKSLSTNDFTDEYKAKLDILSDDGAIQITTEITVDTSTVSIPDILSSMTNFIVYCNGVLLIPSIHYTINSNTLSLIGFVARVGDLFTFVGSGETPVSITLDATEVPYEDPTGNYVNVSTVASALAYIANNWKPTIKSISADGSAISPDDQGNVEITSKVKTLSVNGTPLSPDDTGNIALTNIMRTDSDQILSGKLTANSFVGSGASLTSLNASEISSGTVSLSRLPITVSTTDLEAGTSPLTTNRIYIVYE